jgi:hypothetical protein
MASGHLEKRDQGQKTLSYIENPEQRNRLGFAAGTTMGKILDEEALPKFRRFDAATSAWEEKETRTKIITREVQNAEKDFVPVYRKVYAFLKGNPDVTDTDLLLMDLPPRPSGERPPAPVADEAPALEVDTSVPGQLTIYFYAKGKKRNAAKPNGQRGCEIRWGILATPPAGWDDLPNSDFDTNSPFVIKTRREDMGKFFYCAVRWENTRGEKGPWSIIMVAVVV